jgi:hypothetical protein
MNHLFSGDIHEIVSAKLKQKYTNRCIFGCMVLDIKDIKISECRIDPASNIGSGYVSVAFTTEALELSHNECVVAKIKEIYPQNVILAKNEESHIVTLLKRDTILKIAQVGNSIPVRVLKYEFTPGKDMITVNSTLYTIPKDSFVFQIDPLSDSEKEDLEPFVENIKELQKRLKKVDSKVVKFFNDMLYPFTKKPTIKGEEDMLKLSSSGIVCRHHAIDKLTPHIQVMKKTDRNIVTQSAILVYKSFLNDYKSHIQTILTLCDVFNTPESRKENDLIWQIYKKYKTAYEE